MPDLEYIQYSPGPEVWKPGWGSVTCEPNDIGQVNGEPRAPHGEPENMAEPTVQESGPSHWAKLCDLVLSVCLLLDLWNRCKGTMAFIALLRSAVLAAQSCRTLCKPMDCSLHPWNSPGKNTGVGCHALLHGIFPTHDWTWVSHIAGRCFTIWATREAQFR